MVDIAARRTPPVPAAPWLTALPPAARFAFYGGPAARTAATPVWGAEFLEQPCRAAVTGSRATLWLGPDEYLLLELGAPSQAAASSAVRASLEGALAGVPHALVDIGHRQFAVHVSGPHATDILAGACPLDLDLTQFPVGMCTRTVLAKADIVLWRVAESRFHLEIWRSFAGYVTGVLGEIAGEFHPAG